MIPEICIHNGGKVEISTTKTQDHCWNTYIFNDAKGEPTFKVILFTTTKTLSSEQESCNDNG